MYKVESIDHIVLTVKDIEKTVEFYTKALGMEKEIFKGNRIALKFGKQKINLHQLGKEFEPKASNVKEGSEDLCFISDVDVKEYKKYLESLNIQVIEGPIQRTGAKGLINSIYIRDLDGNLIEISNYL